MKSTQGFLQLRPDAPPRITTDQCESLRRGTAAVLAFSLQDAHDPLERRAIALAQAVLEAAFERYPKDRSCHTCDYYLAHTTYCAWWKGDVPVNARENGCDNHQTHGAPF